MLFRVEGSQLLKENRPVFYKGVNALQTYGLGNAELMDQWNIEIVREFIGNLREQHFSDQPNVWIEVWNEPLHWNNQNNYSHELWLESMEDMVDNLRESGFDNIILVPGNEQGQSKAALLAKGQELMETRPNLLFDLHAYEKWLVDQSEAAIWQRLQQLKSQSLPTLFGEIGMHNVSDLMPVIPFLNAANSAQVSVLACLWNQNSEDRNALLTDDGEPNANPDNNQWREIYRTFLER